MRKINFFTFLWCGVILGLLLTGDAAAQKRKSTGKKKKVVVEKLDVVPRAVVVTGTGGALGNTLTSEPFLSLEPCAKETPEQISELEDAPDANTQVAILLKRVEEKDDWLRSCAIYRLGEFRSAAQNALPVIIKLLRDEKNDDVWRHVEEALWKIPPAKNVSLRERIDLSKSEDVYLKIFGVYSLAYFRPVPGSFGAKDTLNALIEAAKDEDVTVSWLAVMGIRQLGFYHVNTADAIPVLTEILKSSKINPIHAVRAFVPMGANALSAAPVLFDVLYDPKKYAGEKDKEGVRSYSLYLTSAIALASMGKVLVPLLEKEFDKKPFAILQVLTYMNDPAVLPILFQATKNQNAEIRKTAVGGIPLLSSEIALEAIPYILQATSDSDVNVRESAMGKIGGIARMKTKSPELLKSLKTKVIPVLIASLKDPKIDCYAALTLGSFGADAEVAIPSLVNLIKKDKRNYCAESALFNMGDTGKKYLSKQKIDDFEASKKESLDIFNDRNKAKPIKPKTQPTPSPTPSGKEG